MSLEIKQGAVVCSTQGRDAGVYYVCVSVEADGKIAYVSDGRMHKLAKPKKKNVKHLKHTGKSLEVIASKLRENKKVFDSEIKSSLRNFNKIR